MASAINYRNINWLRNLKSIGPTGKIDGHLIASLFDDVSNSQGAVTDSIASLQTALSALQAVVNKLKVTPAASPSTPAGSLPTTGPANEVLATPDGTGGSINVRALVANDIPVIPEGRVANLVSDLAAKAPLASPALTGSPTAPTQSAGDNSTKIATDAFVTTAITNAIAGINPAVAVQAATPGTKLPNSPTYFNGVGGIGATITAGSTNVTLMVDGYTPGLNDRILVKDESASGGLGAGKNGVYVVTQLAALGFAWILTRALDYDQPSDVNNTGAIPVVNGTVNTTTQWVLTSSITAIDGTQALTYAQFSANPATLAPLNSPAFTGTPTAPTQSPGDTSTKIATDAFVAAAVAAGGAVSSVFGRTGTVVAVNGDYAVGQVTGAAPLASPALTGSPTAPTQTVGDNTTKIATDAFVQAAVSPVTDTLNVNTAVVVTPFSFTALVNGIGPVGETTVNGTPAANNQPCMTENQVNLLNGSQRQFAIVYKNANPWPILVIVNGYTSTIGTTTLTAVSDTNASPSTIVASQCTGTAAFLPKSLVFVVMPGYYYKVTGSVGPLVIAAWREFNLVRGAVTQSADLSGSRALGTIYQNNSPNALLVSAVLSTTTTTVTTTKSDNFPNPTSVVHSMANDSGTTSAMTAFFIVPAYHYYVVSGGASVTHWWEWTWDIPCNKSVDLSATNTQFRTLALGSYTPQSNTIKTLPMYQNTDFRVRWFQILCMDTNTSTFYYSYSGEGVPPTLAFSFIGQLSCPLASQIGTMMGPVMPWKMYSIYDQSAAAGVAQHWWEYQLG